MRRALSHLVVEAFAEVNLRRNKRGLGHKETTQATTDSGLKPGAPTRRNRLGRQEKSADLKVAENERKPYRRVSEVKLR